MKLSSYISQINQSFGEIQGNEGTSSVEQSLKNGMEAVYGKQSGETVTGEVLKCSGNEILLSLGRNQLLQAKLEGSVQAQPGQLLTFQIRNTAGNRIVLSPLFENTSQDPNISKALRQAGMPENSITTQMVKAMMEEGLPIDRQSLYQMNRLVNANPQTAMQTLAQMQRLSLPVTPENIFQFEAYKNYQHQLSESLVEIADAFTQTFQEMTGSGNISQGLDFYQKVLAALSEEPLAAQAGGTEELSGDAALAAEPGNTVREAESALSNQGKELPLSEEELTEFADSLKRAGVSDSFVQNMLTGKAGTKEILGEIEKLLSDGTADREALFSLLEGKNFKSVLKNEMNSQWLLKPEEVAEEHSVDKLYERLNSQMKQLSQALSQTARADTPLARTLSNVSGNIDFMHQMNQMFTYVQIPLKMQSQEASGELFVYTNKKNLAKKDGTVSALLHLDMEHLGSVDVHVALTDQKVSTKFYLKDEKALDLVAAHIDLLNDRLEKRGYSMSAQFIAKEEDKSVMDEILEQNKNISVLSGYSFDARA